MKIGPMLIEKMIHLFSAVLPDEQTAKCISEGFSLVFSDVHFPPVNAVEDPDDLHYHVDGLDDNFEFEPENKRPNLT